MSTVRTVRSLLRFVKTQKGKYVFLKIVTALKNTVSVLVSTLFPGLIINELVGEFRVHRLVMMVGTLTLMPLFGVLWGSLLNTATAKVRSEISIQLETDFYRYTTTMDYEHLENPDIQTKKIRASETVSGAVDVIDGLVDFGAAVLSLLAIFAILVQLNPLIIAMVIVTIYINSLITKWMQKNNYEAKVKVDKESRKLWGFEFMVDAPQFAKELRLFNIGEFLITKVTRTMQAMADIRLAHQRKKNRATTAVTAIKCVEQILLYTYFIFLIMVGRITVGGLTIYLSATAQFFSSLSTIVNEYLKLCEKSLSTDELVDFLSIPRKQLTAGDKHPVFTEDSVIEFKNVSFRYPGSDRFALKNVNIKIDFGERLCIVGQNGAGKTTFIKLLTRLYFPTDGQILLNGIDINKYNYHEYQRLYAPVFQDFCMFYLDLKENIILNEEYDKQKLNGVCHSSGLDPLIIKLKKGYETQVDKWIDEEGFEPSGGEGQRIAIARACYQGGNIFLLDEPTAALDPIGEYEIYTQFHNMIKDKTAILVTHRLSAVQLADKVAVFDDGQIIEYGTHAELYTKGGKYKEMFDKQAEFYVNANLDDKDNAPINPTSNNE